MTGADGEFRFFRDSPDPLWLFEKATLRLLEVNDAARRDFGYSRDEFLAMTIADLRLPEDVPALKQAVQALDSGFHDGGIWHLLRKSGEPLHADIRWQAVTFAGREAVLASVRDVTRLLALEREREWLLERERKARLDAEAAARHARTLFEAAPGSFLVLEPRSFSIVAVSDAYLAATMTHREQLEGRPLFEVFRDDPKEEAAEGTRYLRASLERVLSRGQPDAMPVHRYPIPAPSGGGFEDRYWSSVNTPARGPDGEIAFLIHRVEDVTEYVRAAEAAGGGTTAAAGTGSRDGILAQDILLRSRQVRDANERLLEQEANLRTAQRLLGLGIWSLQLDTGALAWSDNVFDIYGLPPGGPVPGFDAYVAMIHPEDRAEMERRFAAFEARMDRNYHFAHRVLRPDGRVIHVRGIGELTEGPDGRKLTGVVQDVTAQVEADARLAQSAAMLRIAGHAARLGGWRYDLDPETLSWSAETAAIHDEPVELHPSLERALDYYPPPYRERVEAMLAACIEQGTPFDGTLEVVTAKGRRLWVRAIGEAERDATGRIRAVHGAFQDITEFVEMRERSERLSHRLSETLEHISDALFTLDRDWRFGFLNGQAERLLARPRAELLGKVVWDEFPAAVGSTFQTEYERAMTTGETVRFTELYPPLDTWFEVNAYPVPEGLAVYFRDVTARRELDDRLRQSQKLEAVGQLTGGIAHDFNNLLTVILGNAELMAEKLDDRPALRQLAEMTLSAAGRGAELTNRLLAFARRQALTPKLVDMNRLVAGMDGLLRRTLSEAIDIEVIRAGGLWLAEVDPGQLEAALLNLAINSRDAMPAGGCLTIETANARLDEDYARAHQDVQPGQYVAISVSDTGTGMTAETAARAFEPFYTTKDVGRGSGLGLSMVYGFVKQSGGHAKIYSEPDEGTTIRLYFPRALASAAEFADGPGDPDIAGGDEHVLVVEDDDLVREHLLALLRGLGYRVTGAAGGPEAMEILQQAADIDLLFTDVVMPGGMNGRELAEAARRLQPDLPVLFTSGYTDDAIVHHGRLDHGVQLLQKPYRRQDLALKVRAVLNGGAHSPG